MTTLYTLQVRRNSTDSEWTNVYDVFAHNLKAQQAQANRNNALYSWQKYRVVSWREANVTA